jgi:hypothetical protein
MCLEGPNHLLILHAALLLEVHQVRPPRLEMDEGHDSQGEVSPRLCEMHHRSAVDLPLP